MSRERLPDQLNQSLNKIQRRLPLEAAATTVSGVSCLPLAYLGLVEYWGRDPKMLAGLVAIKLICLAGLYRAVDGTVRFASRTRQDIQERRNILTTAREKGLLISGVVLKRVRG